MTDPHITGGCRLRPDECETLLRPGVRRFASPEELRAQLADATGGGGNWSAFRRFSPDARRFTLAAGFTLFDGGTGFPPDQTVGLLVADDFEHQRDQDAYFRDYLEGGALLGSSSRFVHTLPTSAAADASVCLGLRGPLLYLRDETDPVGALYAAAADLMADGEAERMLIAWRHGDEYLGLLLAPGPEGLPPLRAASPGALFAALRHAAGDPTR